MLIKLLYDPRLLEEVIQLELRRREESGDPSLLQEYHRRSDPFYRLTAERRESEFAALHRRLFSEWGFEARLEAVLEGNRAALSRIGSLAFLRALRIEEEGADLASEGRGQSAAVRINPALFLNPDDLAKFLDHEMTHLGDLLDPEFAHDPDALMGVPPHRRRLVQERYRIAWATTVDGRLARRGRIPLTERAGHSRELARCFPAVADSELDRLLETLWGSDRPTHGQLMAVAAGGGVRREQLAGAPCPLCGFPTHRWGHLSGGELIKAIRLDAPEWEPDEGLCEHCLEAYQARSLTDIMGRRLVGRGTNAKPEIGQRQ